MQLVKLLIRTGGRSILLGGRSIPTGGRSIPIGGRSIRIGGRSIPIGGRSIPIGGRSIPLGGKSIPLGGRSIPIGGKSIPLRGRSIQLSNEVESCRGVSPPHSHGTVLETLASHGSSCSITKIITCLCFTNNSNSLDDQLPMRKLAVILSAI